MKKCLVISDSFKGSLESREICRIAERVIPEFEGWEAEALPSADGGEGSLDAFIALTGAEEIHVEVSGPWGEKVDARYAMSGRKALIEMAQAAGLNLTRGRLNPAQTGTFGVGEMMRHAINKGAEQIYLCLGGSATNDGGCGCAAAMGVKFFDEKGKSFVPTGATLSRIAHIDWSYTDELLDNIRVTLLSDVDNPLCGPEGAACTFAEQKGADEDMQLMLDEGLYTLADVIRADYGIEILHSPGAGAAGGMGGGCMAFFDADIVSGTEAFLSMSGLWARMKTAELIISGEGRLDSQSLQGKLISGVAELAKRNSLPLIVLCGSYSLSPEELLSSGIDSVYSINPPDMSLEEAMPRAPEFYEETLRRVMGDFINR